MWLNTQTLRTLLNKLGTVMVVCKIKIGSKLVLEPLNFLFENGIRKFGDIKMKQQILFDRLSETQKGAMKGDISILNFEKCLREKLSSVLRTEEVMWAQKAKIN